MKQFTVLKIFTAMTLLYLARGTANMKPIILAIMLRPELTAESHSLFMATGTVTNLLAQP